MTKCKKILKVIIAVLLVLCFLFLFLVAPRMKKPDMSAFEGVRFAHRGYFDNETDAPENSLPSFEAAIEKGFGIELDVQLSSDGVAMVFHDADLERMCGVEGKIWEYACAELQQMKLLDSDCTIPTLQQAMDFIGGRTPVLVEYKMDRVDTNVCVKGNEILQNYDGDYCIQAFDPRAVMWYKKNAPDVVRGQLCQEYWKDEKYNGKALYLALTYMVSNVATRPDFISYKFTDAYNISLNLCRLMGAKTACWTLRSADDYNSVKGDFDMYIFDSFDISQAE